MDYELIEAVNEARFCIIWLHGLGADGYDFIDIVDQLNIPTQNIRFIFPHADLIPITMNMGIQMRAWYDVKSLGASSLDRVVDIDGINDSITRLNKLINRQIEYHQILSSNIIIAGFSQGGVIAIYTAITSKFRLAGVIGLSTYLPAWENFKSKITNTNKGIPILIGHGNDDQVLPEILGRDLSKKLAEQKFDNQYRSYLGMDHCVCAQEIKDIANFITKVFKLCIKK